MIGFFDSGKGGLTTLADCIKGGFKGEIVYYADYKNAPFGNKGKAELKIIANSCIDKLKSFGADTLVCACNTLSLACDFKKEDKVIPLRIPFELIENYSSCLFLGTAFSVNALPKWYFDLGGKAIALKELATLIDNDFVLPYALDKQGLNKTENCCTDQDNKNIKQDSNNRIYDYLKNNLNIKAETVVLGCTHFKLVKNEIKSLVNAKKVLSINDGVVQKLKSIKGENLTVYLQKEKMEDYTSTLLSLTNKPNIKYYD